MFTAWFSWIFRFFKSQGRVPTAAEVKPKPGKVLPVVVECDGGDSEETYLEAHQILSALIERLRHNPDPEVQGAVAWAEKALWG